MHVPKLRLAERVSQLDACTYHSVSSCFDKTAGGPLQGMAGQYCDVTAWNGEWDP